VSEPIDTTPVPASELRALCERLATEAGDAALAHRGLDRPRASTKSSITDLVTDHDLTAERSIRAALEKERPGDSVLGEEAGAREGTTEYRWSIDPIDGTTNFFYGLPMWGTSIAVSHRGLTVAGAVRLPALGRTYSAHLGGGATRDGKAIRVSDTDDLASTLVATGFGYAGDLRTRQASVVSRLIGEIRDIRRSGSAAVDLCLVADGSVDAYYEEHLNDWDVAAGLLIASEAGARTSDFDGGPVHPGAVLVATPRVHGALQALLARARPSD